MNLIQTRIARLLPAVMLAAALALAGCQTPSGGDGDRPDALAPTSDGGKTSDSSRGGAVASTGGDRVIAEVMGVKVNEKQLLPALYDSYGLDVLLKVVQLNMARQAAANANITVSPTDVAAERDLTLSLAFPEQKPEDYDQLLTQLLQQQRVSRAEFQIVMETNACLRALSKAPAMSETTDEAVREAFNAQYGERVQIRHIALNNLQGVAEAQRRLRGEPAAPPQPAVPPEEFEKVARDMSVNRATAAQGGLLPPFARTTAGVELFAQAAFALQPGEVSSDPVQDGGYFHLIKLEKRLPPEVIKFEDVRDAVRQNLILSRQANLMAARRAEMAQVALRSLQINEPTLKKQFEDRLAAANPARPADNDEVRQNLNEERGRLNTPTTEPIGEPTTSPAAMSTTAPTTQP